MFCGVFALFNLTINTLIFYHFINFYIHIIISICIYILFLYHFLAHVVRAEDSYQLFLSQVIGMVMLINGVSVESPDLSQIVRKDDFRKKAF